MLNRTSLARRTFAANKLGVPSIVAGMSQLMSSAGDSLIPYLLIAMGDVAATPLHNDMVAFTTWAARPLIAEALARAWARQYGATDDSVIYARAFGEMVAIHCARGKTTLNDVTAARNHVLQILLHAPPTVNEFRSLISDIVSKCRATVDAQYNQDYCKGVITPARPLSSQTFKFYEMRGHVIPVTMFANLEFRNKWMALCDPDIDRVDLADVEIDIDEHFTNLWGRANADFILGYYEGKAIQNPDKPRALAAGAVFSYITALAKNSGVTTGWVQRRKRVFSDRLPGVNLDAYVSEHVVRHYIRLYTNEDCTAEDVYRQLVTCWSMLQIPEGVPLAWIIEQSSNNHVTCLTTIADVVTKLKFFDCDLLMNQGIPEPNFVAALEQAKDLMRDPFCSIIKPTVLLRQYADLAYLCTYIKRDILKDEAFMGYRGSPSSFCTLAGQEIQAIGKNLYQITAKQQAAGADIATLYSNLVAGRHHVREITGELFLVPREGHVQAINEAGGHDQPRDDILQREDRGHWPQAARNLPAGTTRLDESVMVTALKEAMSERAKAFNFLMNRMYSLQVQVPLTLIPENSITVPSSKRAIPAVVAEKFQIWGIHIPEEWRREVPAYVPNPSDRNQVQEQYIVCPPRPVANNPPAQQPPPAAGPVIRLPGPAPRDE